MASNLTKYSVNLLKSVGYSTIDVIKEMNPAIGSFADTNQDTFKSAYQSIKHLKSTSKALGEQIKDSEYGAAALDLFKNIKEDLKTGKFYNMERDTTYYDDQFNSDDTTGDSFGDGLDSLDNFDFSDNDNEISSEASQRKFQDKIAKKASEAVGGVIINSSEYLSASIHEDTKIISGHSKALYAMAHSGMRTINENLGKVIEFSSGPVMQHMENSKTFYETETKLSQERNMLLTEIRDTLKNQYSKTESDNSMDDVNMSNVMDAEGMVNLSQYWKAIKSNMKNVASPVTGLLDMVESAGGLGMFTTKPLEFITKGLVKKAIPNIMQTAMENFNETLSGIFSTAILKLRESPDTGSMGILKKLFNVRDDYYAPDPSKYNKGAVPFDGIVRKSIVEVIPTYLSQISSAVSNTEQKLFDFDKGTFKTVSSIKEDFERERKSSMSLAHYDIERYFDSYLQKIDFGKGELGKKRYDGFKKDLGAILDTSFKRAKLFNPKNKEDLDMKLYGLQGGKSSEINFEIIKELFNKLPERVKMKWATNLFMAKGQWFSSLRSKDQRGDSIITSLINNSLDKNTIKTREEKEAAAANEEIRYKRPGDNDNKILSDIRTVVADIRDLIKNGGTSRGGGGRKRTGRGGTSTTVGIARPWEIEDANYRQKILDKENRLKEEERLLIEEEKRRPPDPEEEKDQLDYTKLTKEMLSNEFRWQLGKIDNNDPFGDKALEAELEHSLANKINSLDNDKWYKLKIFHREAKKIILHPAEKIVDIMNKADHAIYDMFYGADEGTRDKDKGIKDVIIDSFKDVTEEIKMGVGSLFTNLESLFDKDKRKKMFREFAESVGVDLDGRNVWSLKELAFGKKDRYTGDTIDEGFVQDAIKDFIHKFKPEVKRFSEVVKESAFGLADVTGATKKLNDMGNDYRARHQAVDGIKDAVARVQGQREELEKEFTRVKNGEGKVENASSGMKRVKKTGVVAVSEGEMILPPDMNPFNAEDREEEENKQKERYQKYFNGNIPNFAAGGDVSEKDNTSDTNKSKKNKFKLTNNLFSDIISDPDAFFTSKEFKRMPKDVQEKLIGSFSGELGRIAKLGKNKWDKDQITAMNRFIALSMNWWNNDSVISEDIDKSKKEFILDAIMNQPELIDVLFTSKTFKELKLRDKKTKYEDLATRRDEILSSGKKKDKKKIKRFDTYLAEQMRHEFGKEDYVEGRDKNLLTKSFGELANGFVNVVNHLFSNLKKDKDGNKTDDNTEQKIIATTALKETKKFFPQMVAGGLIGSGISLATSMIGGPLFGAAVGAGFSLVNNSKKVQKMLFGNEIVDEEGNTTRDGSGALSKDLTEKIYKYGPGMGRGAIGGAIAAMLPFIPGGPVAGAIVGSAVSFASKNEKVHEYLFGEEGKLGKDSDKKIKEILPKMGAGAIAGLVLGPFGVTTNLILGSAIGWASTTNKFKDIMFGEENEKGEREGGLIMSAYHGAIEPVVNYVKGQISDLKNWASEKIKKPLMNFVDPLKQGVTNMFRDISGGIKSIFNNFMEEHLGAPLDKFLKDKVFNKIGWILKKMIGGAIWLPKKAVSAPFKLLSGLGKRATAGQIIKGKADNLTAEQRLAFMKANPTLRIGKRRTFEYGNIKALDKGMAGASLEQVEDIQSQLKKLFAIEDSIKGNTKDVWKKYDKKVRRNKNIKAQDLKKIRGAIERSIKDGIFEAPVEVDNYIAKLNISRKEKDEVRSTINEYIAAKRVAIQDKKTLVKKKSEITKAIEKELGVKPGHINEKNILQFKRNIDKEVEAKRAFTEDPNSKKAKGVSSLPDLNERQEKRHKEMKDTINMAIDTLADRIASSFKEPVEKLAEEYQAKSQDNFEEKIEKNDKKKEKKERKKGKKKFNKAQKKKDKKFYDDMRDYRDMSKRRVTFTKEDGTVGYRTMSDDEFEQYNRSKQDTVRLHSVRDENAYKVFNTKEEILEMGYNPRDITETPDGYFVLNPRDEEEMTREQALRYGYTDDEFEVLDEYTPDVRQGFFRNFKNKYLGKLVGTNGRVASVGYLKNITTPVHYIKSFTKTAYRKANTAFKNSKINREEKTFGDYIKNGGKHLAKLPNLYSTGKDVINWVRHAKTRIGSKIDMDSAEFEKMQDEAYNKYRGTKTNDNDQNNEQKKFLPAVIPGEGVITHPVEGAKKAIADAAKANTDILETDDNIEENTKKKKDKKQSKKKDEIINVMESDKELSEKRNSILEKISSVVDKIFNKEEPEPKEVKEKTNTEETNAVLDNLEKLKGVFGKIDDEPEEKKPIKEKGKEAKEKPKKSKTIIDATTNTEDKGVISDVVSDMAASVVGKPSKKAISEKIDHEDSAVDGIAESEAVDKIKNGDNQYTEETNAVLDNLEKLKGVFGKIDDEPEEKKPVFSFWKNHAIKFTKDKKGNMIPDRGSGDTKKAISTIEEDEKEESEARNALKEQPGFFKRLLFGTGQIKDNGKESVGVIGAIKNGFGSVTGGLLSVLLGEKAKKITGGLLGVGGAVLGMPLLASFAYKYIWNGGLNLKKIVDGFFGDDGTVNNGQKRAAGAISSFFYTLWNGGTKTYTDDEGKKRTVKTTGLKGMLVDNWTFGVGLIQHFIMGTDEFEGGGMPSLLVKAVNSIGTLISKVAVPVVTELVANIPSIIGAVANGLWQVLCNLWDRRPSWLGGSGGGSEDAESDKAGALSFGPQNPSVELGYLSISSESNNQLDGIEAPTFNKTKSTVSTGITMASSPDSGPTTDPMFQTNTVQETYPTNQTSAQQTYSTDPVYQATTVQETYPTNPVETKDNSNTNTTTKFKVPTAEPTTATSGTAATAIKGKNEFIYGTKENPVLAADTSQISQLAEHYGGLNNSGINGNGFTINTSGTSYRPGTIKGLPEASSNPTLIKTVDDGTIGSREKPASLEEINKRNEACIPFIKNNPLFKQLNSQIQGKMINIIQGKHSSDPYLMIVETIDGQQIYLTLGELLCWEGEVTYATDNTTGEQISVKGTDLVDVYHYAGVHVTLGIDFALSEEEKSWGQTVNSHKITVADVIFKYGWKVCVCGKKSGVGFTLRVVSKILRGTRKVLRLVPFGAFGARQVLGVMEKATDFGAKAADKLEKAAHSVSPHTSTRNRKSDQRILNRMAGLDTEIENQQKHILRRQQVNDTWGKKVKFDTGKYEEGVSTLGEKRNELYEQLQTKKGKKAGEFSSKGYDKAKKREAYLERKVDAANAKGNSKSAAKYQDLLDKQKETNNKLSPKNILEGGPDSNRGKNNIFERAKSKGAKLNMTDDVMDNLSKKSDLNRLSFTGKGVDVKDLDNLSDAGSKSSKFIQKAGDFGTTVKSKITDNKVTKNVKAVKNTIVEKATDVKDKVSKKAGEKLSKVASKADGSKATEFFKKCTTKLSEILSNKKVAKFTKALFGGSEEEAVKVGAKIGKMVGEKLIKKLGECGAEKIAKLTAKIAASAASAGILNILGAIKDFIDGWSNANTILGVVDDVREPSLITKLICGVVNTVAGLFFITSLVPLDFVVDVVLTVCEHIPGLSKLTSGIREDRKKSQEVVDKYNEKHGTNYSIEEYNDKDKITTKMKNGVKDFWLGKQEKDENGKLTGKRKGGAWNAIKSGSKKAWNWLTGNDDKKTSKKKKKTKKKGSTIKNATGKAAEVALKKMNEHGDMQDIVEPGTVLDGTSTSVNMDSNLSSGDELYNTVNNNFAMTNNAINSGMQQINNDTIYAITTTDKLLGSAFGFVDNKGKSLSLSEAAKYNWDADIKKNASSNTIYAGLANALGLVTGNGKNKKIKDTGFVIAKKDTSGSGSGMGSDLAGKGNASSSADGTFISQRDSKYAGQRFNIKSDDNKQTIGDSGCAPASAAMVVNSLTGDNNLSMKEASSNALRYKDTNSGVTPDYFADEFSRHGIGTEYISGDPKTRNGQILSNLAQGNRVVLMGQDINNKSKVNSPFGPDGHYVVADGLSEDGKSIYVNDPEGKRANIAYDVDKLLSGTKVGVSANIGMDPRDTIVPENINIGPGSATQPKDYQFEIPSPTEYPRIGARHQYMGWQMITSKSSKQYKLIDAIGGKPTFDDEGLGRIGQRYAVAMKGYYGEPGDYLDITQTDGSTYKVVLADIKGTENGSTGIAKYAHGTSKDNYNMVEFVLDKSRFYPNGSANPFAPNYHPAPGSSKFHPELGLDIASIKQAGSYWTDGVDNSTGYVEPNGTPAAPVNVASTTGGTDQSTEKPSNNNEEEGKIPGLFSRIKEVFHNLGIAFGLIAPDPEEEENGANGNVLNGEAFNYEGGTITSEQKAALQQALVNKMESVKGTLKYGQENSKYPGTRDPDKGGGDCSSTVNWAYKKTLVKTDGDKQIPVDIGNCSSAQRTDEDTYPVIEGTVTPEHYASLELGDILLRNGHSAMYYGDGKVIEQGSPTSQLGPMINDISKHSSKPFDLVRRWKGFSPDNISEEGGEGNGSNVFNTKDVFSYNENYDYNDAVENNDIDYDLYPELDPNYDPNKSAYKTGPSQGPVDPNDVAFQTNRQRIYKENYFDLAGGTQTSKSGERGHGGGGGKFGPTLTSNSLAFSNDQSNALKSIWDNRYNSYHKTVIKSMGMDFDQIKDQQEYDPKQYNYGNMIKARDSENNDDFKHWKENVINGHKMKPSFKVPTYTDFTRYIASEAAQFKGEHLNAFNGASRPKKSFTSWQDASSGKFTKSVDQILGAGKGSGLSGKGSGLKDHLISMPVKEPKEIKSPTIEINTTPTKVESKSPGTTNNNLTIKNENTKVVSDTSKEVLACMSSIIALLTKISSNTGKIGAVVELLTQWIQLEERKSKIDKTTENGKREIQNIDNKKANIIKSIKDSTSGSADDALLQLMNSAALLANS